MDLLAHGRRLRVPRTHATYTAAATKVMPNVNRQIAARIRPVRMFLRASRRVMWKAVSCVSWSAAVGLVIQSEGDLGVGHHRPEQQGEIGKR